MGGVVVCKAIFVRNLTFGLSSDKKNLLKYVLSDRLQPSPNFPSIQTNIQSDLRLQCLLLGLQISHLILSSWGPYNRREQISHFQSSQGADILYGNFIQPKKVNQLTRTSQLVTHHPKDGHPPFKINQKEVYYRLEIWHLALTHKIKTR